MNEIECYEIRFNFVPSTGASSVYCLNEDGVTGIDEDAGKAIVFFSTGDVEYVYNVEHALYKKA